MTLYALLDECAPSEAPLKLIAGAPHHCALAGAHRQRVAKQMQVLVLVLVQVQVQMLVLVLLLVLLLGCVLPASCG